MTTSIFPLAGYIICFGLRYVPYHTAIEGENPLMVYRTVREAIQAIDRFLKSAGFDAVEERDKLKDIDIDDFEERSKNHHIYSYIGYGPPSLKSTDTLHPYWNRFVGSRIYIKPVHLFITKNNIS
jgi:hypothetical protein